MSRFLDDDFSFSNDSGQPNAEGTCYGRFKRSIKLLTRQRLLSLNVGSRSKSNKVTHGYTDPVFKQGLSRGYYAVNPIKRPDANEISKYGPFYKESSTALHVGGSPFNYGRGKPVIFPFAEVNCVAWELNLVPDIVKEKIKDYQSIFTSLASYVGSFLTLSRYSRYHGDFKGRVNPKLLQLDEYLYRLKLPKQISGATINDLYIAKITEETHPGVVTRYIAKQANKSVGNKVGNINKENVIGSTLRDVQACGDRIGEGDYRNTVGYYCVGSREKISTVDFGDFVKSRPLFIPEACDLLVGSAWLEVLKMYWNKNTLFKSEIGLGHSDNNLRYFRRLELDVKFKFSFEFDGKEWDSSVHRSLIKYAFEIYRSCFEEGRGIDNHFQFLFDTLANKRVVLHNGNTFDITHGVSTGHAGTANINSMVNWILGTSTMQNCPFIDENIRDDYELQIMGDDVVVHTNADISDSRRKEIIYGMEQEFNYKAKDGTRVSLKEGASVNDRSSFLKRVINDKGLIDTKVYDIGEKILCGPEYSKARFNRTSYFYRRFRELTIYDEKSLDDLCLYLSFIDVWENNKLYNSDVFKGLFYLTDCFTLSLESKGSSFLSLFCIDPGLIVEGQKRGKESIKLSVNEGFNAYHRDMDYVDYGVSVKKRTTVGDCLRNYAVTPVMYHKNVFKILHEK